MYNFHTISAVYVMSFIHYANNNAPECETRGGERSTSESEAVAGELHQQQVRAELKLRAAAEGSRGGHAAGGQEKVKSQLAETGPIKPRRPRCFLWPSTQARRLFGLAPNAPQLQKI